MMALLWLLLVLGCGHLLRLRLLPTLGSSLFPEAAGASVLVPDSAGASVFVAAWLVNVPVSLLFGIVPIHTLLFFVTQAFSYFGLRVWGSPLVLALAVVAIFLMVLLLVLGRGRFQFRRALRTVGFSGRWRDALKKHWPGFAMLIFVGLACYFLFFRTFYQTEGRIFSGASVVGDYGPHIANISAFVRGDNYAPLDYPVFAGAGMRYHFFFFFFSASLHALGLSLPLALNLASGIGLFCFSALLGVLAVYFTGRRSALFWIQPLWFFQSSLAWFPHLAQLWERSRTESVGFWGLVFSNTTFIGTQPNDNWGLWNMNVYANQRHLLFALAVALLVIMVFLPSLRERGRFRELWLSRSAWLSGSGSGAAGLGASLSDEAGSGAAGLDEAGGTRPLGASSGRASLDWNAVLALALLMVCLPYWHGAVTLGLLLILFVMALWARFKLAYLSVAFVSLGATLFYSRLFSGGVDKLVRPQFLWGFLSAEKSLGGILVYLIILLGLAFVALIVSPFWMKRQDLKIFTIALGMPLIFAMTLSLTPDINVNHKYIIMTRLLLCLPILALLMRMWEAGLAYVWRRLLTRTLAVVFAIILMLSGLLDFGAFYQQNKQAFSLEIENNFVSWLEESTEERAIFMTPTWFYHPFYYSGRQAWYGWPYYAWSAGYDSAARELLYFELWSGCGGDSERFVALVNEYDLSYILVDDGLRAHQKNLNEDFFLSHFPMTEKVSGGERITIYDLTPYRLK